MTKSIFNEGDASSAAASKPLSFLLDLGDSPTGSRAVLRERADSVTAMAGGHLREVSPSPTTSPRLGVAFVSTGPVLWFELSLQELIPELLGHCFGEGGVSVDNIHPRLSLSVARIPPTASVSLVLYVADGCKWCPVALRACVALLKLHAGFEVLVRRASEYSGALTSFGATGVPFLTANGKPLVEGAFQLADLLASLDRRALFSEVEAAQRRGTFDLLIGGATAECLAAAGVALSRGLSVALAFRLLPSPELDSRGSLHSDAFDEVDKLRKRGAAVIHGAGLRKFEKSAATGVTTVVLENGSSIEALELFLPSRPKFKGLSVPGEALYSGAGVVLDYSVDVGILKGQDVVVVGGSSLGVRTAIQLSPFVKSVTLLEAGHSLWVSSSERASLGELTNATVLVNAKVTEFKGDGSKLTHVVYEDSVLKEPIALSADLAFVRVRTSGKQWDKGLSEDCENCTLPPASA